MKLLPFFTILLSAAFMSKFALASCESDLKTQLYACAAIDESDGSGESASDCEDEARDDYDSCSVPDNTCYSPRGETGELIDDECVVPGGGATAGPEICTIERYRFDNIPVDCDWAIDQSGWWETIEYPCDGPVPNLYYVEIASCDTRTYDKDDNYVYGSKNYLITYSSSPNSGGSGDDPSKIKNDFIQSLLNAGWQLDPVDPSVLIDPNNTNNPVNVNNPIHPDCVACGLG